MARGSGYIALAFAFEAVGAALIIVAPTRLWAIVPALCCFLGTAICLNLGASRWGFEGTAS